jgi:DNA-binding GntR family transcriptional regulator
MSRVFEYIPLNGDARNGASLSDQAYEHILTKIVFPDDSINSSIQYGGKITESKIAQALQISNGPVREAIYRLRQEGWVHTVGNRGSFFVDFSDPQIANQIYHFRLTFETGAFYTLACTITEEQIKKLESILNLIEKSKQNSDMESFRKADILFHLHVVEFAGGPQYKQVFRPKLLQWYAMSLHLLVQMMGKEQYSHRLEAPGAPTHRELFDALAGRNSSRAADLISKHFSFVANLVKINSSSVA